jgi:hypothetical protein
VPDPDFLLRQQIHVLQDARADAVRGDPDSLRAVSRTIPGNLYQQVREALRARRAPRLLAREIIVLEQDAYLQPRAITRARFIAIEETLSQANHWFLVRLIQEYHRLTTFLVIGNSILDLEALRLLHPARVRMAWDGQHTYPRYFNCSQLRAYLLATIRFHLNLPSP